MRFFALHSQAARRLIEQAAKDLDGLLIADHQTDFRLVPEPGDIGENRHCLFAAAEDDEVTDERHADQPAVAKTAIESSTVAFALQPVIVDEADQGDVAERPAIEEVEHRQFFSRHQAAHSDLEVRAWRRHWHWCWRRLRAPD